MRIAHVSNFSPNKLGTGEGRIVALASAARERGHDFTLFGGSPVHPDVKQDLLRAGAVWRDVAQLQSRPLLASRMLARDFDVIQLNMVPPRSSIALAAYAAWPARVLFVDRVSGPPADREARRPVASRFVDRLTMVRVHQLAGITDYVRRRAQRRFGLPDDRTCTIYNGVDIDRFVPADRPPVLGRPLEILTVAALIPDKGIDVLIRAVSGLTAKSWRLTVAGAGPEESRLRQLVAELGIGERVRFLGQRDDVPELMRSADVFVHPAVWQEALGNTVLEGMASGCCVIASRVGGIPELATHEVEALLVPAGDASVLCETLGRVAQDEQLRRDLAENARDRVVREFSLDRSIHRLLDWYEASAAGRAFS